MAEGKRQIISEAPEGPERAIGAKHQEPKGLELATVSLTALGVVYGDIGTSPLYAFRECFRGEVSLTASHENVLGVLSLIFWSLIIVISVKYLVYVMRADNRGEGGILALMALLSPWGGPGRRRRQTILVLGLFGAALLYGDGTITPAISVLSAIEGLKVATPVFDDLVVPLTVVVLIALFALQRRGTAKVGSIFGPVMLVWFAVLAVLGVIEILQAPQIFAALNPSHAVGFFMREGGRAFFVLGAVFLVVTGGEALYADMGHFGSRPIRLAWFVLVLPALLLNYFGQGALLLRVPDAVAHPFYHLVPRWGLYPMVLLSTVATVIASQAIISGAFSLTRQAGLLGQFPRMTSVQTSSREIGQIYIPVVNWALMAASIGLVLGFRHSTGLAAAYGVAITTTMVITTLLAFRVARERWRWGLAAALAVTIAFLVPDLAFFSANMTKVREGGWYPLLVGALVFLVMTTWRRGRNLLAERLERITPSLADVFRYMEEHPPARVPGTAVCMSGRPSGAPPVLLHHIRHNQVLHEQALILTVITEDVPHVAWGRQLEVEVLQAGVWRVRVRYGFMDTPDVPAALERLAQQDIDIDPAQVTYYLGRENVLLAEHSQMSRWRRRLFAFFARNAVQPTTFFRIPPDRVVELGMQVEL